MKIDKRQYRFLIFVNILTGLVCLLTILRYAPRIADSHTKASNQLLEEQRQATKDQIEARHKLNEQTVKTIQFLESQVTHINTSLDNNTRELKRIRNDKKDIDYSDYSSEQLQRAVADAARQCRSAQ